MIDLVQRHVLPAAYALLPPVMTSDQATAELLAIGLQESKFLERRQRPTGPARGFWQFEVRTTELVLEHAAVGKPFGIALEGLRYRPPYSVADLMAIIGHNDVAAACAARCLLWSDAHRLPQASEADLGWLQYLTAWRPGAPRRETWGAHFAAAWARVRAG